MAVQTEKSVSDVLRDYRDYNQRRRETVNVTEEMIDVALKASVPGGSQVAAWLPQNDAWTPHQTARDVIRCAIEEVLLIERHAAATLVEQRLMSDPGSPAYEAARTRMVQALREIGKQDARNGFSRMADDLEAGELMQVPAWVALQLLADPTR